MKPELKAKIIAALRSGEYEQITHKLRVKLGDGYCHCWAGVVCDVVDPNGWQLSFDNPSQFAWRSAYRKSHPGNDFWDEIGISDEVAGHYIAMNDTLVSFKDIADRMEADDRF